MVERKDLRAPVKRYSRPKLAVKATAPPVVARRKPQLEDVAAMMFGRTATGNSPEFGQGDSAPSAHNDGAGQKTPGRQSKSEPTVVKGVAGKRRYRNLDLP